MKSWIDSGLKRHEIEQLIEKLGRRFYDIQNEIIQLKQDKSLNFLSEGDKKKVEHHLDMAYKSLGRVNRIVYPYYKKY